MLPEAKSRPKCSSSCPNLPSMPYLAASSSPSRTFESTTPSSLAWCSLSTFVLCCLLDLGTF